MTKYVVRLDGPETCPPYPRKDVAYFAREGYPGFFTDKPSDACLMALPEALNTARYLRGLSPLGLTVRVMRRGPKERPLDAGHERLGA